MPDNSPDDQVYVRGASTCRHVEAPFLFSRLYFDFFPVGAAVAGFALL
jgi:hypothetical protein